MSWEELWIKAIKRSNSRYLDHEKSYQRTLCLSCKFRRGFRCIFSRCIYRYPNEEELEELR